MLNINITPTKKAKLDNNKLFQFKYIKLSNLYLGTAARVHINHDINVKHFNGNSQ